MSSSARSVGLVLPEPVDQGVGDGGTAVRQGLKAVLSGARTIVGLATVPCQSLTNEMGDHLSSRALLAPCPLLHGQQNVIVDPDCGAHASDASASSFFLAAPITVLRECRRVLTKEGRLAVYTTGPELRGTPAAPEPIASRGSFYDDDALAARASQAGFVEVAVIDDAGGQLLTARSG